MSEPQDKKRRSSLLKKIRLAVLILVIVFAAVYVPAKLLAVKYTNRGTQLYNEGKIEEAMVHYERAMKIFPGFKPARNQLGRCCSEKAENEFNGGGYPEAKRLYKRAVKLGAEVRDFHYKLAQISWRQGNNAEALIELERHLKERPNDYPAQTLRRTLQRQKETKAPVADVTTPAEEEGSTPPQGDQP